MSFYNFPGAATAVQVLAPVDAANTAAATSTGVDLRDYDGTVLFIQNKGAGTGTLTGAIEDSADNVSFAAVSGAAFTQAGTTANMQSLAIDRRSLRRYVRYVGTVGTGPQLVGVTMVGGKKIV